MRTPDHGSDPIHSSHAVLVVDAMAGVRAGVRWLLSSDPGLVVVAEAAGVVSADALLEEVDVVVSGLRLADGVAADVARLGVPVVVHTWLPPDERDPAWTRGCAAVLRHGALRTTLAPAVRAACQGVGADPERDIDVSGSDGGSR